MARAPFSVFKRTSTDSQGKKSTSFSARFFDPDGKVVRTKALKATSATKAHTEAKALLEAGEAKKPDNPLVLDFLRDFWKADSPYAQMKALRGKPLSARYILTSETAIRVHWTPYLEGVRLRALTIDLVEAAILDLSNKGKSPRIINVGLQAIRVPMADYSRRNRQPDPLTYCRPLSETPKERGILTIDEISKIVGMADENPRARCAVLLGALCGLRMGECFGLEPGDIDGNIIHIVHNWVDDKEGIKAPKCGSKRDVPMPAVVKEAIELCLSIAPEDSRFVLWNEKDPTRPCDKNMIERGFTLMLLALNITPEERKTRNLCFHGLRHAYVSMSRASGLPDFVTMRLAGHKSAAMLERYSHAEGSFDFNQVRAGMDATMNAARLRGGA